MIMILLIVLIIGYLFFIFQPKSHKFWDQQNVSRNHSINGIINNNIVNQKINTELIDLRNLDFSRDSNLKKFITFINHNYIKGYQYDTTLINWILNNASTIGLFNDDKLVGTISNKPIQLKLENKHKIIGYVDFLCVDKQERKKNYAPILISKLIKNYDKEYAFIFKKEDYPLPFDYLTKFYYYIYKIRTNNIIPRNNIREIIPNESKISYYFYLKYANQFCISYIPTIEEFNNLFLVNNNNINTFISNSNSKISCLFSFYISNISIGKRNFKIAELLFCFSDDDYQEIIEFLKYYLNKKQLDFFSIPGLGNNFDIINNLETIKGKVCYLQMYNYGFKKKFNPNMVLFPIP